MDFKGVLIGLELQEFDRMYVRHAFGYNGIPAMTKSRFGKNQELPGFDSRLTISHNEMELTFLLKIRKLIFNFVLVSGSMLRRVCIRFTQ